MSAPEQSKLHFGWSVEDRALAWFLESRASRAPALLRRNYRCRGGELDLILEERASPGAAPELVFVEVRARLHGRSWQAAIESVDHGKRQRLRRCIAHYLAFSYRGRARTLRLDVLGWDGNRWEHLLDVAIA